MQWYVTTSLACCGSTLVSIVWVSAYHHSLAYHELTRQTGRHILVTTNKNIISGRIVRLSRPQLILCFRLEKEHSLRHD